MSKSVSYTILMEPEQLEQLQAIKEKTGVGIQYNLREAIRKHLAEINKK